MPNAVIPISQFSGGEIWVQDDGGDASREVEGQPVLGKLLHLQNGPVC